MPCAPESSRLHALPCPTHGTNPGPTLPRDPVRHEAVIPARRAPAWPGATTWTVCGLSTDPSWPACLRLAAVVMVNLNRRTLAAPDQPRWTLTARGSVCQVDALCERQGRCSVNVGRDRESGAPALVSKATTLNGSGARRPGGCLMVRIPEERRGPTARDSSSRTACARILHVLGGSMSARRSRIRPPDPPFQFAAPPGPTRLPAPLHHEADASGPRSHSWRGATPSIVYPSLNCLDPL